jgi:signal transduction histidine kinase
MSWSKPSRETVCTGRIVHGPAVDVHVAVSPRFGSDARVSDSEDEALSGSAREHGIGLRAQILVVLGVGFALTVILLGLATSRLGSRAFDADRRSAAEGTARALLRADPSEASLDALIGTGGIVGVELRGGGSAVARGRRTGASVEVEDGARSLSLWIEPAGGRSLPGLLFLYVGITAAAILFFTYVLLGRSIVRPVEDLTRASERSTARDEPTRVPVRGAAEVARLAVAFNAMQAELASERGTLRRRLEELERTTRELASAQRSLVTSEKMASVGRLAAGVAHEIGNPLSAILGLVELVESGDLAPDEQREFLRRVRKETERIHRIIRDLLDFARDEPATEAEASCDLVEVVEDAVRLVGPQKDLQKITIERRFAEDCPPARGAAPRLAQVVLNLLLNAADAIQGEGTITLEVRPIESGFVELVVADSGPGIPASISEHLFEPFVTTKPPGQGTGLGLAVCHTIIERLGGTIEVETPPEGGARFTVRLPITGEGK